jgi:potassium channel subfamily K
MIPAPPSPALVIKDTIIYGQNYSSPGSFTWHDYELKKSSSIEEEAQTEASSPLRIRVRGSRGYGYPSGVGVCNCPCTCGAGGGGGSFAGGFISESDINAFDDSFVDSDAMHPTQARRTSSLTKMDFIGYKSPKVLDSDVRKEAWSTATVAPPPSAATAEADLPKPSHVKKLLHRSRTAPAMVVMSEVGGEPHVKHSPSSSPLVSQAFICLVIYLSVGVAIYVWREDDFSGASTNSVVDAFYFCIVTMCTIGYGDITPTTAISKLFACAFVLVGFGLIDILLAGVVNYVLDKQEVELLNSVLYTGHYQVAKNYLVDVKKGRMRIRLKVVIAFGAVTMCIGVGTLFMGLVEDLGWLDSFYLACMSVTTVGYGDHAFKTASGRIFASIWLLVSTLAVARSFLYLAEARIESRNRRLARRVLEKDMTYGDLIAADLDDDGSVRYSAPLHFHILVYKIAVRHFGY